MRTSVQAGAFVCLSLLIGLTAVIPGQRGQGSPAQVSSITPADATARIVSAAQAVLRTLDDAGRSTVQFPFDGPQKARWSNFPSGIFERQGLKMGDLTATQRSAVMTLLATALSADGYKKVVDIMRGDEVLKQSESGNGPAGPPPVGAPGPGGPPTGGGGGGGGGGRGRGRGGPGGGGLIFGEDLYYLAFLGTPSTTTPWMLQFGGHHLAINLTLAGSQASMAPSLPAAQPATYTVEGRTVRPLGDENDKAFALVNALDTAQKSRAILTYRVADLVLGPGQDGKTIQPEGILASSLTAPQQTMLLDVVREWAGIMNDAYAEPRMAEIKSNLPQTYFAWSGPTANGSAAYFRIQGPALVIEYAPQGGVDHIHTIYRDPTNDYGAKIARR
jgi:hypothetical protein